MTNRDRYLKAVENALDKNIFYHSLALEACMAGIYDYLKENNKLKDGEPELDDWTLAGLVHDIDYQGKYKEDHPNKTKEALLDYGLELSNSVDQIVKAHAPSLTNVPTVSQAQWSIFCADSLTGLIVAVALVYPSKKLSDVKTSSVLKRFLKEPRFAAGTRREEVVLCEDPKGLGIPLADFIEICLNSMQRISPNIGL
ncbi:MAG: phosphohydrolase [Patescibacteria group bacterium]|jgi:predicted hydrolase (HD superfamily)